MPNRRETIHDFYRSQRSSTLLTKSTAASISLAFKGEAIAYSVVVRTDINGYSDWARNKTAQQRAEQLNAFFSSVVPLIEDNGGVYFRDEGDCVLALFSDYFVRGATYDSIERYCMIASARTYGNGSLTAKTSVSCGRLVYFQKAHEVTSGDWSAEGEAFVRSARLEQALSRERQIVFFADEYDSHFASTANVAPSGVARWNIVRENIQVAGIGASGGWTTVVRLVHK